MNKPLIELLADYATSDHITEEQLSIRVRFKELLLEKPDCFDRQPGGHITASAWIINPENNAALLTHHKKLNKWLQLGGHCDGNPDVKAGALREAQEESGIQNFEFVIPCIFDLDIHAIPNLCEYHYDVRFILRAKDNNFLISEESHSLAWISFDTLQDYSQEESVVRMNKKAINFL